MAHLQAVICYLGLHVTPVKLHFQMGMLLAMTLSLSLLNAAALGLFYKGIKALMMQTGIQDP